MRSFGLRAQEVDGLDDEFGEALAGHVEEPGPSVLIAHTPDPLVPPPNTSPNWYRKKHVTRERVLAFRLARHHVGERVGRRRDGGVRGAAGHAARARRRWRSRRAPTSRRRRSRSS